MSLAEETKGHTSFNVKPGDLVRLKMNPPPPTFQSGYDWVFRRSVAATMYLTNEYTNQGTWIPENAIGVFVKGDYGCSLFLWDNNIYRIPNHLFEKYEPKKI